MTTETALIYLGILVLGIAIGTFAAWLTRKIKL
jgi:hypothetical protein